MSAKSIRRFVSSIFISGALALSSPVASTAEQSINFKQAIVEETFGDAKLTALYRNIGFETIWTGNTRVEKARIEAFLNALEQAPGHGLPGYDVGGLKDDLRSARSDRDRGHIEVELTKLFLAYSHDIQTGIINPSRVD